MKTTLRILNIYFVTIAFLVLWSCSKDNSAPQYPIIPPDTRNEGYLTGDFHQHTTYTDGLWSFGHVMSKNYQFGLNWWANSEHGGAFNRNGAFSGTDLGISRTWDEMEGIVLKGLPNSNFMWRWQCIKEFSFHQILYYRGLYPGNLIIQGFEWNVPGHEHADVGIITHQFDSVPNADDLAEFEYKFDNSDTDTIGGKLEGWIKSTKDGHQKTLEAIEWAQKNHPGKSWVIPGHPDRQGLYSISDLRDMNNAGADVCFGFEGMPGHQKYTNRGAYSLGKGTFGGAGIMTAKIGGVWDALLSEGRHWWAFANSDFHDISMDFYPGEYQKNYVYVSDKKKPITFLNGLRSGNGYFVTGDLIDSLYFKVNKITIGGTCEISSDSVEITIRVHDPEGINNNIYNGYNKPILDHIDIIQGLVTDKIIPGSAEYTVDNVNTTKLITRFDSIGGIVDSKNLESKQWVNKENGWKEMKITIKNIAENRYFRLRGTNHGLNVNNETDSEGNPLSDDMMYPNNAQKAFADLWFYSNPIFVKRKN
jgi:hypothetical protein